jgi:hypothetical protein
MFFEAKPQGSSAQNMLRTDVEVTKPKSTGLRTERVEGQPVSSTSKAENRRQTHAKSPKLKEVGVPLTSYEPWANLFPHLF